MKKWRNNNNNNKMNWWWERTYPYSSWPAVSRTSRRATSSSITHCLRYESSNSLLLALFKASRGIRLTLNSRVILINEMALNELDSQSWLSNTLAPNWFKIYLTKQLKNDTNLLHRPRQACTLSRTEPINTWGLTPIKFEEEMLTYPCSHCYELI